MKDLKKFSEIGDFPNVEPFPQIDEKPKRRFSERFANPINIPIYLSASYFFNCTQDVIDYHEGTVRRARYGRYDNPTIEYAEAMLAHLDKCEKALLFPSGMNAITTTLFSILSQGDHIIFTSNCYRNISRFCKETLAKYGIDSTGISSIEDNFIEKVKKTLKSNTKVIFLESPSNPHMSMVNIEEIKNLIGEDSEILIIIDSTLATPYNFNPINYGVDLVIHSCTKYLSGHSDIMAGSVAGNDYNIEKIRQNRNVFGGISDGLAAYILVRSMSSLNPRMDYYNRAGQKMAEFLNEHEKIKKVHYLGLPSHPHYSYAKSRMKGNGGVISFEVDGSKKQVAKFVESLRIPYMASNFGSQYTFVEQYSLFTLYSMSDDEKKKIGVNDQLIRMSLGFEDIDNLIEDIDRSLLKI